MNRLQRQYLSYFASVIRSQNMASSIGALNLQHPKTKKEGQLEMNLQRGTTSRLGRSSLAGGLQKPKHSEVLSLCNYTEVA